MPRLRRGATIQPEAIIRNGLVAMNLSLCEMPAPYTEAESVCVLESGMLYVLASNIKAVEIRSVTRALEYLGEYISDPTRFISRALRKKDPNMMAAIAIETWMMPNPPIATTRARVFVPEAYAVRKEAATIRNLYVLALDHMSFGLLPEMTLIAQKAAAMETKGIRVQTMTT